jgi:hypothetical protein
MHIRNNIAQDVQMIRVNGADSVGPTTTVADIGDFRFSENTLL